MYSYVRSILILTLVSSLALSGTYSSVVKAFEDKPGYIAPAATLLNTLSNTGWNKKSSITRPFQFTFSIPLTVAVISDKDRSYENTYVNEAYIEMAAGNPDDQWRVDDPLAVQRQKTPTILGRSAAPVIKRLDTGYTHVDFENPENSKTGVVDTLDLQLSDGIEELAQFNWLPIPAVQLGFSTYYTALNLRYMGFGMDGLKINMPAFSLRHDLSRFFNIPVRLALFSNSSFQILDWTPGEDVRGTAELRGYSGFTGLTVGKSFAEGLFDIFVETGMEYSRLKTGGHLQVQDDGEWDDVRPDLTLSGRQAVKTGLFISFYPGRGNYALSTGSSLGTQGSFSVTPVYIESEQ